MRMWIDTEFNGFEGELISLALAAEDGHLCYIIREAYKEMEIVPWVAENVIPYLYENPYGFNLVAFNDQLGKQILERWLKKYDDVEIIADWPEDIHHFCKFLITGPGWMMDTPLKMTFTLDRTLDGESKLPHNALYDALGNMEQTLTNELEGNNDGF